MKIIPTLLFLLPTMLLTVTFPASLPAEEAQAEAADPTEAALPDAETQARYDKFTKTLSGVKLVGRFTIVGRDMDNLPPEEYTIHKVSKLPNGDYWSFDASIKYGNRDLRLPLPLEVKWSGDTPVITLTNLLIPTLGTFSSRVLIYNGKYAGTWTHGKVGGHMFGVIEPLSKPDDPAGDPEEDGDQENDGKQEAR